MIYIMYRITIGDNIYIGSTKDFKQRRNAHKYECKNQELNERLGLHAAGWVKELKVYQMIREAGGWDKCEMTPIEEYECEEQLQARMREEHWRREYNANMNSYKAYRTEEERIEQKKEGNKEWGKKHYEENKETINVKHREHYHATIEKQKERRKAYYEANSEKYECNCGGKYTPHSILRHERTKKHLDYLAKTLSLHTVNGTYQLNPNISE